MTSDSGNNGIEITHQGDAARGEYRATVAGSDQVGRLTWQARGNARIADHTLVPESIGGRGVAAALVNTLVADAKAEGFKIVPQCSYVDAQFRRHPEWADLLADTPE